MVKRASQASVEFNGRAMPNLPQKTTANKPFRVTRKTDNEEVADDRTSPDHKVRLSSDIPHSTYIALYTYAATVQKRINLIINEMILSHISA